MFTNTLKKFTQKALWGFVTSVNAIDDVITPLVLVNAYRVIASHLVKVTF